MFLLRRLASSFAEILHLCAGLKFHDIFLIAALYVYQLHSSPFLLLLYFPFAGMQYPCAGLNSHEKLIKVAATCVEPLHVVLPGPIRML